MSRSSAPAALTTLIESKIGKLLDLPPALARLYGRLRMSDARTRPHVISNFASTLDGVVSLNVKGHESGGDISGFSAQDRAVMGILRAVADAVIIGTGTLAADRGHVWTAGDIFPDLARDYDRLRASLGKRGPPLNVVVSGSGRLDPRLPIFASGRVRTLILTTAAGAKRLRTQGAPEALEIRILKSRDGAIRARDIVDAVCERAGGKLLLVEGGPRLLGDFYAERLLDEQFLTLSPQIAGHGADIERISLVMGRSFAPKNPLWGNLVDLRRGASHLYLRYSFS
jgi:riboflavin biosynthesis pyrimidine reductase